MVAPVDMESANSEELEAEIVSLRSTIAALKIQEEVIHKRAEELLGKAPLPVTKYVPGVGLRQVIDHVDSLSIETNLPEKLLLAIEKAGDVRKQQVMANSEAQGQALYVTLTNDMTTFLKNLSSTGPSMPSTIPTKPQGLETDPALELNPESLNIRDHKGTLGGIVVQNSANITPEEDVDGLGAWDTSPELPGFARR